MGGPLKNPGPADHVNQLHPELACQPTVINSRWPLKLHICWASQINTLLEEAPTCIFKEGVPVDGDQKFGIVRGTLHQPVYQRLQGQILKNNLLFIKPTWNLTPNFNYHRHCPWPFQYFIFYFFSAESCQVCNPGLPLTLQIRHPKYFFPTNQPVPPPPESNATDPPRSAKTLAASLLPPLPLDYTSPLSSLSSAAAAYITEAIFHKLCHKQNTKLW